MLTMLSCDCSSISRLCSIRLRSVISDFVVWRTSVLATTSLFRDSDCIEDRNNRLRMLYFKMCATSLHSSGSCGDYIFMFFHTGRRTFFLFPLNVFPSFLPLSKKSPNSEESITLHRTLRYLRLLCVSGIFYLH